MTVTATVSAIATPSQAFAACGLTGVDFSDAFSGATSRSPLTAMEAAHAMFKEPLPLVQGLMATRNRIVSLFGLKTPEAPGDSGGLPTAGIFPIVSETPQQAVLGLDDKHLDFRIWVHVEATAAGSQVTLATLVHTHNLGGKAYLTAIMPFHKLLSRLMLERALKQL